jgi:heterodisulfide reductase subunit A
MRVGIFICHCGHNIKSNVDVEALRRYFEGLPSVATSLDYTFFCSEPGQRMIKEEIERKGLERVVIAACTPSLHTGLFREVLRKAGLNPYLLKVASIREHCAFVGEDVQGNTEKAKRLILSALYASTQLMPAQERKVDVVRSAAVLGGGVAGLSAALFLGERGLQVYLLEKEAELGGTVKRLKSIWPSGISGEKLISSLEWQVLNHRNVVVRTSGRLLGLEGSFGDYSLLMQTERGEERFRAGGIIVAIGARPFNPRGRKELWYGKDERILTTSDVEEGSRLRLKEGAKVAILHCVGSRDETIGRPYCSKICCVNALRVARMVKEVHPEAHVECFYMDMRAHPKGAEELYEQLQREGVIFTRAAISEVVPLREGVVLRGEDTFLSQVFEKVFDWVVLSCGLVPAEDAREIASLLHVPLDKDGFFLEAHPKLRPLESPVKGILLAGSASGPKDIEESIASGRACAARLFTLLSKGYTLLDPFFASVSEKRCSGCRVCEAVCVFRAIRWDEERRKVRVDEAACAGCGLCASLCPSSAIGIKGAEDGIVCEEVSGLLEGPWMT